MTDEYFIKKAIELAHTGMDNDIGGPFGALIVRNGEIVGSASNSVHRDLDPTAHAEVMAIRDACQNLQVRHLVDCTLYSSCEPCPMCFSAMYFAKIKRVVYAASHADAGRIAGFYMDDLYAELAKGISQRSVQSLQIGKEMGLQPFFKWTANKAKKK
ncbi:MAG: nucleoside deaminase [Bacteroidota bacterium]